jgi:uncharacterized protein YbjT (DUF2867 family)
MIPNALVIGGRGLLGSAICRQLAARNVPYAAGSRSISPWEICSRWKQFDAVTGDGLADALTCRSMVFNCATSQSKPTDDLVVVDRLIEAARRNPFHIVQVSISGIEASARHLAYYRMKLEIEEKLAKSGVPHTIVRPTQFHEFVDFIIRKLTVGPFTFAPTMVLQPLDVDFAAAQIVTWALDGSVDDQHIICGPERIATRPLVTTWAEARHRRSFQIRLPSVGPLAALSKIQSVAGVIGGRTWSQWNAAATSVASPRPQASTGKA